MRRKDNALMLSIGMETRQIYRMLFYENISMILRTYLISIALSSLFYINFLDASISFSYSVSIIIYTFILLLIMMLMILYMGYRIMKQKTIDV
ncbi:FtsX-like permease family protein [Absiella sp. AM29-15]|uniref:FtsX-like permease family protein n=1 Tax=Absiella sp. AM29-15 TaxID=2292278 RepID=UPI001F385162|nr:FtsX-like permease family protein [Absiella sp. AM29-15]